MLASVYLVVVHGPQAGAEFRLAVPSTCTIGRACDCDIVVMGAPMPTAVSRHHCRIDLSTQGARLVDVGSYNGTYVNGRRLGQTFVQPLAELNWWTSRGRELQTGDVIELGGARLAVMLIHDELESATMPISEMAGVKGAYSHGALSW